ncbi:NYN domain-containing protein [Paenibacillus xanthanilyticus]|uniref:NYN domain-containing protein n=1 Tax=Paenibacillus xanthanilyticus TaxID=1783531 RepID=A0ABV8KA12_9BACL
MLHIFWDNSNIHFVGLNHVFPLNDPGVERGKYRTHFLNLLELARDGRELKTAVVAGSVPPPSDGVWNHLKSLGVNLQLLNRDLTNKEVGVDETIQTYLLRTMIDVDPPETIALLTGDGAGEEFGIGFLSDIKRAHKLGWNIEVYSWGAGCKRELREFAQQHGKYVNLEDHYNHITFILGGRRPV